MTDLFLFKKKSNVCEVRYIDRISNFELGVHSCVVYQDYSSCRTLPFSVVQLLGILHARQLWWWDHLQGKILETDRIGNIRRQPFSNQPCILQIRWAVWQ